MHVRSGSFNSVHIFTVLFRLYICYIFWCQKRITKLQFLIVCVHNITYSHLSLSKYRIFTHILRKFNTCILIVRDLNISVSNILYSVNVWAVSINVICSACSNHISLYLKPHLWFQIGAVRCRLIKFYCLLVN